MYAYKELRVLDYKKLQQLCSSHQLSGRGKKAELITRLLEFQASSNSEENAESSADKPSSVNMMADAMNKLVEAQATMMHQQTENQKMIMELLQSQGKRSIPAEGSSCSGDAEDGTDPKTIKDRLMWLFADAEGRMSQVKKEVAEKSRASVLKDMIESVQRAEERLSEIIGGKLSILEHMEVKEKVLKRFKQLQDEIYEQKKVILEVCDQVREEEKGTKGLPTGIVPPDFNGDPKQFPIWWEAFEALVHENKAISKFYKYRYLRQIMKGEAAHCLDGFSPLVECYEAALDHVKKKYGQPRKIVRHIMASIIDIPPLVSDDLKSVQKYHDVIVGKIHDLKRYVAGLENPLDALVLPILESKLAKVLKRDWERELVTSCEDEEFATMDKYLEWCSKEVRARETSETVTKSKETVLGSKDEIFSNKKGLCSVHGLPSSLNNKGDEQCLFCRKGNHKLEDCFKFKKLDIEERWKYAKDTSLCFLCLKRFHAGRQCETVNNICGIQECKKRHHAMLHNKPSEIKKVVETVVKREGESTRVTASTLKEGYDPLICLVAKNNSQIMPSAMVFAVNGRQSCPVRIAFDTMCQDSFVTERVVNALQLYGGEQFDLEVEGFGGEKSYFTSKRVEFGLSPMTEKDKVYGINALVKRGRI